MNRTPYLRRKYYKIELIMPFFTIVMLISFSLFIYPFTIHKEGIPIGLVGDERVLVSEKEITIQLMKDYLKVNGKKRIKHLDNLCMYLNRLPESKSDIYIKLIPCEGLSYKRLIRILKIIRKLGITKVIIEDTD